MIRRLLEGVTARLDRTGVRWTLGVALPIVMVLLDPAVFHSRVFGVGMPVLGVVKPYCYTATALALVAFVQWLLRRQPPSALASGLFAGGALFAVALGTAIAPFSLLGILFLGMGLLGFSPFLMAAVYARAARAVWPSQNSPNRLTLFLVGFLILLGVPSLVQDGASRAFRQSVADVVSGHAGSAERGTSRLRRWSFLLDLDRLVAEYMSESDPIRQRRIAAAYAQLTGQDVVQRAAELVD